MAYPDSNRGWLPSTNERFIRETEALEFDTQTILDTEIADLKKYTGLVSLVLDTCTFDGDATFEDLPVLENAATITTITAKDSTGLEPGDNDGIPASWGACEEIAAIDVSGNGWSQAQVNAFLVALNTARIAGLGTSAAACTLDISGNAIPSGAGATAVTALEGASPAWTVTADS